MRTLLQLYVLENVGSQVRLSDSSLVCLSCRALLPCSLLLLLQNVPSIRRLDVGLGVVYQALNEGLTLSGFDRYSTPLNLEGLRPVPHDRPVSAAGLVKLLRPAARHIAV